MERSRNCAARGEADMPSREAKPWPEGLSDVDIDVPIVRGTVKSYAQNSLQAAERSVVMQWRDR